MSLIVSILFSAFFGVVLLWSSAWIMISRGKVLLYLPFVLAGFAGLFYAGVMIANPSFFSFFNFQRATPFFDIFILIMLARRKIWKVQ